MNRIKIETSNFILHLGLCYVVKDVFSTPAIHGCTVMGDKSVITILTKDIPITDKGYLITIPFIDM